MQHKHWSNVVGQKAVSPPSRNKNYKNNPPPRSNPNQWPCLTSTEKNHTRQKSKPKARKSFASMTSKTATFAIPHKSKYDQPLFNSSIANTNNCNSNSVKNEMKKENNSSSVNSKTLALKKQKLSNLRRKWRSNPNLQWNHFVFNVYGIKIRGICNRNLDCFINAIMQSLLSLPLFVSFVSNLSSADAKLMGNCTSAIYNIMNSFTVPSPFLNHNRNCSAIGHPSEMIHILDEFRQFSGRGSFHGQQDAHEFLMYLIEKMHDELVWSVSNQLTRKQRKQKNKEMDDNKGWSLVSRNIHHKTQIAHEISLNESFISILFAGEFYQMIKFQNKRYRPSVGYQPFFSVSIDINHKHISQALQSTLAKQLVSGIVRGRKEGRGKGREGKEKNSGYKILHMSEVPFYLILHLKRFVFQNGQCLKIEKYVQYDHRLVIGSNLLFDKSQLNVNASNAAKSTKMKKFKYFLRCVIVHSGDFVNHGHYTCFCRRDHIQNKRHLWLQFNDANVRECNEKEVTSQQAYVLIYQKC